jgi:hypothetical protein
METMVRGCC